MRDKITIVYLIDFLATREGVIGGTEKQLVETIRYLDRNRFRPILMCLQEFHETEIWKNLNCEKHILHVYSLFSVHGIKTFLSFLFFLYRNSVDIVQTFFFDSTIFGVTAAKMAGNKIAISCRRDMGFWYNPKILFKLKFINIITDYILVNSDAVKRNVVLKELVNPEKIKIFYNGINRPYLEAISNNKLHSEYKNSINGKTVVGIVANFNRTVKRVDVFIRAAKEALQKKEDLIFVIIGGGRLEENLRQLVKKLKIEDSILFLGKQHNPSIFVKDFNIGIICSDSEGLSNVLLEYMIAGIPIIATNVGGNSELVKHGINGYLVDRGDFYSISKHIINLSENHALCEKIGKTGYSFVVNNFTWEKSINKLEEFYRNISNDR